MESWVISQTKLGEQVTVKKIVDRFESKPYGWDLGSIEVVLGWLVGNGKVAITINANPVVRTEAASSIRNTGRHQHTVVAPQTTYDAVKVANFKAFCADFDRRRQGPDRAGPLARTTAAKTNSTSRDQQPLLFVSRLSSVITLLDRSSANPSRANDSPWPTS